MWRIQNFALALSIVAVVGLGSTASAATQPATTAPNPNFNLTTSPVFITLSTTPGVAVNTPVRVQNNAALPIDLDVKLMKFRSYDRTGQAEIFTPTANDASVKWVKFSKTNFTAQPGQLNTLTMTITPDHTASFGYYYAVVFTKHGQPANTKNVTSVSGSSAVLTLLDVKVPGEKRQLSVANFKSQHKLYEFLPANFTVSVKNVGNVHAVPTGDIFISRDHKTNLATLPVNAGEGNVLPGSTRDFAVQWADGFPAHITKRVGGQVVTDKDGKPQTTLSWATSNLNKFRIGKYYAHLVFVYNNGTQDVPIESEIAFWVFPWKIILVLLIIVGLLLFAAFSIVRRTLRLGKKATRRDGKPSKD